MSAVPSPASSLSQVQRLVEIVATLRAPGGCPWDREQTHASLRGALLEEAHEVIEAIDSGDLRSLRDELGDLLLHVIFHAQIETEQGGFDLDAVAEMSCEKMIRRHPHVFGDKAGLLNDSGAVLTQWEEIKRREKGTGEQASVLDGVSKALPELLRAQKAQTKAARVGCDWPGTELAPVLAKLREEMQELEQAVAAGEPRHIEEEAGDLLFSAVNVARRAGVDATVALHGATEKFMRRFRAAETALRAAGKEPAKATAEEWDAEWEAAKGRFKSQESNRHKGKTLRMGSTPN
ncbi:MAG: nucleoside triphosphate pyrophosphohydrolase [Verrucomicrobia bacterium]|nr:nucleoside triphosphate pyrophosphohydrolase [Verrucomicrobiota bacterium]